MLQQPPKQRYINDLRLTNGGGWRRTNAYFIDDRRDWKTRQLLMYGGQKLTTYQQGVFCASRALLRHLQIRALE